MSVGFGFSAGDFIAALNLVGTVIDALRDSGEAGSQYRELVRQLLTLETALMQVKRLDLDDSQYAEVVALRQAAAQCQRTIDDFWRDTQKYQPSLGSNGRGSSNVRDGWMKIKWAICKKDDVTRLKADLLGHTEAIQMLLATVQMANTKISGKQQEQQHQSLSKRVQDSYFSCMTRLAVVAEQGKQLFELTSTVLRTNIKVFQIVLQIQHFITKIPGQVDRQQPVYMLDALGKTSPFHLEFVRSAEALRAILKVNFSRHGNGSDKIERGEFVIQDSSTKRDIDLERDWELCFSPGQRVDMSMIFTGNYGSALAKNHCPRCLRYSGRSPDDIECQVCGMTYRLSTNLNLESHWSNSKVPLPQAPIAMKRKRAEEDLAVFRRVRMHEAPADVSRMSIFDERETFIEKIRANKRRNRITTGSQKRILAQSIGSDTDDTDNTDDDALQPSKVSFDEVGSSARRLRRKINGEKVSLIFDDPPPRITELEESDSGEEGFADSINKNIPYPVLEVEEDSSDVR